MDKLTNTAIKAAKPREKPWKLFDGRGLYLDIRPNGGQWWRFKYRFGGKEKLLSLGTFPEVTLQQARSKREVMRSDVANGVDPGVKRQVEKSAVADTFEAVGREWFQTFLPKWKDSHSDKILRRLEMYIFPLVGGRSISDVQPKDLLECLRRVEQQGNRETARRALQICGQIFRYAIATGRTERDPTPALRGALSPAIEAHHASITDPKELGALLRAIEGYDGSLVVRCALRLAPLVFVRPGELRSAEWSEIDFDKSEWQIPSNKMKMGVKHIVPLSSQSIAILKEIRPITGEGRYVFPSARTKLRPLSDNALLAALRRMGYQQGTLTVHGFRSTASTLLNEQGKNRDWIERQLAHGERDGVRAAYNYAEYLPERRNMMQEWADYLGELQAGAKVVPIRAHG
jgi:integrase